MSNFYLESVPPSILHKILSKVATNHIRDFGSARIAFSGFNQIGRDDYFYQSANLFGFNDWIEEVNAVRTFRLRCYQAGNPEAIYLRGMHEFFQLHLLDEGREKIHLAAERGLELAKFVDGMLNLAFSVDDGGLFHNYPNFSREFVHRMNCMIRTVLPSGHWGYEKPQEFMSLLERIKNPIFSNDCCCSSAIEEPVFVVSYNGSTTQWKCDRCFWQCEVWDFCNEIHLTAANWPIED